MTKKKLLIYAYNLDKKELITFLKNINYDKYEIDLLLEENQGIYKKNTPKKVNIIEFKRNKNKLKLIQKAHNIFNKVIFKLKKYHKYDSSILFETNSLIGNYLIRNASKNRIMYINNDYTNIFDEEEYRKYYTTRNIYDFNTIIFNSNESQSNFLKYYPSISKKTHVINYLINNELIEKKSAESIEEKIKRTDINLLLIQELNEQNNITKYLNLINELKEEIKNLKLFIIGDGIDRFAYETFVEDNNLQEHVFLLGSKSNPYPYIKKCNYLLFTDEFENNSLLPIESLMLKTQVISTINFSDDLLTEKSNYVFNISNQYNKMKDELKTIILNKEKKKIKLDIDKTNDEKMKKIEELIEKK